MITISNSDFKRIKEYIYVNCGISINDKKKSMVEARLQKRLKRLNIDSFSEYCDYLFSDKGNEEEFIHMINEITTNKTDFFREPAHFELLVKNVVPELLKNRKTHRLINIWSAGCSSGEEPYSIAMVMKNIECSFFILATDISTKVLEKAKLAIYEEEKIEPIPTELKKKYLLKSKDPAKKLYRIAPEIRETVRFRRLNLMEGDFGFREPMDIIFCRNVIIYFDKPTQEKLIRRFINHLSKDGYLFMGHSETLFGMDLPLKQVAPTVYRRIP